MIIPFKWPVMPASKVPEWFNVAWKENDAKKGTVSSQETEIFKGSGEHLIFYYRSGLPQKII